MDFTGIAGGSADLGHFSSPDEENNRRWYKNLDRCENGRQIQWDGTAQISFVLAELAQHLIQTKLTVQVPRVQPTIKLSELANDKTPTVSPPPISHKLRVSA